MLCTVRVKCLDLFGETEFLDPTNFVLHQRLFFSFAYREEPVLSLREESCGVWVRH